MSNGLSQNVYYAFPPTYLWHKATIMKHLRTNQQKVESITNKTNHNISNQRNKL